MPHHIAIKYSIIYKTMKPVRFISAIVISLISVLTIQAQNEEPVIKFKSFPANDQSPINNLSVKNFISTGADKVTSINNAINCYQSEYGVRLGKSTSKVGKLSITLNTYERNVSEIVIYAIQFYGTAGIYEATLSVNDSETQNIVSSEKGEIRKYYFSHDPGKALSKINFQSYNNMILYGIGFSYSTAAIDSIEASDSEAPSEYYNLNGIKVSPERLTPGIYIVKTGAKVSKMIIN